MKKILKSTLTFMLVLASVLVLVACNPTGGEDYEYASRKKRSISFFPTTFN